MKNTDFMQPNVKATVTAGASPTFVCNRGFVSVTNQATGQHRLTLVEAIPTSAMVVQATRSASAHGSIGWRFVDTTTIDIYTFDNAGAAANVNFSITVERVGF